MATSETMPGDADGLLKTPLSLERAAEVRAKKAAAVARQAAVAEDIKKANAAARAAYEAEPKTPAATPVVKPRVRRGPRPAPPIPDGASSGEGLQRAAANASKSAMDDADELESEDDEEIDEDEENDAPDDAEVSPDANADALPTAMKTFLVNRAEEIREKARSSAAVAEYLKPYLDQLARVEKDITPFPPNAVLPWPEIESAVMEPGSAESFREVAERYGIKYQYLMALAKGRRWRARRAILQELAARRSTALALADHTALMTGTSATAVSDPLAREEEVLVKMVEDCIRVFDASLKAGHVRFKSARDIDTLMRLLQFLKGKAERIEERRHALSPEMLEGVAAKVMKRLRWSPELAGVVTDVDFTEVKTEAAQPETPADEPATADPAVTS